MRPPNLRRYCTPRRAARLVMPVGTFSTTAEYVAAFIHLNFLIP